MKFSHLIAATAAVTLAASPAIAQSNVDRASSPVVGASELGGRDDDDRSGSAIILALLAAAAIIAAIYIAVDGGDDTPISA